MVYKVGFNKTPNIILLDCTNNHGIQLVVDNDPYQG
jgi:hypothetical protein